MALRLGPVQIKFLSDVGSFLAGNKKAIQSVQKVSQSIRKVGASMITAGRNMGTLAAIMTGALLPVIKVAADFERQMSAVKAISLDLTNVNAASAESFKALEAEIRRVGRTTRFTAGQAAQAAKFLALAGFNAQEVTASLDATVRLASAGMMGLARTSEIVANNVRAFQLNVFNAVRVSDALAIAATNSNTTIEALGVALSFAAPAASLLGVSVEETTAALGTLANAGIKGSTAGTGLSRVMVVLGTLNEKARAEFLRFGLTADDVSLKVNTLRQVLKNLANAGFRDLGSAAKIFDIRGSRISNTLVSLIDAFEDLAEKEEKAAGTSFRISQEMENNLTGQFIILKSAVQDLIIELVNGGKKGQSFNDFLRSLVNWAIKTVAQIKKWVKENRFLIATILRIVTTLAPFIAFIASLNVIIGLLIFSVSGLITVLIGLISTFKLVAIGATAASWAVGALTAVIATLAIGVPIIVGINLLMDSIFGLGGAADTVRVSLAKLRKDTQTVIDYLNGRNITPFIDKLGKILDLINKGKNIKPLEKIKLAELKDELGPGFRKRIDEEIKEMTEAADILRHTTQQARLRDKPDREGEGALGLLEGEIRRLIGFKLTINKLDAENNRLLLDRSKLQLKQAKAEADIDKIRDARAKADKALKLSKKQFIKIEEELNTVIETSLESEIHKIKQTRKENEEFLRERLAQIDKVVLGLHTLKKSKVRDALLNEALTEGLKISQMLRKNEAVALDRVAAALDRVAESRRKEFRDAKIADLRVRGDVLRLAEAESQKILEINRSKHDKLMKQASVFRKHETELRKKNRHAEAREVEKKARELEGQARDFLNFGRRAAGSKLRKAQESVFGGKGATLSLTKQSVETEDLITKQLIGQVRTLQDMFRLHKAIAIVRQWQEQRAIRAAQMQFNLQEKLLKLQERRDKAALSGKSTKGLDRMIRGTRMKAGIAGSLAAKRAGEANLGGMAVQEMEKMKIALEAKLTEIKDRVALLRGTIGSLLTGLDTQMFGFGLSWMLALRDGIVTGTPKVLDAIDALIAQIKRKFKNFNPIPPIPKPVPKPVVGVGAGAGGDSLAGGAGGPSIDNRAVNMVVENHVDLENLTRHIGLALSDANRSAGRV